MSASRRASWCAPARLAPSLVVAALLPAQGAAGATFPNACANSVTASFAQIDVTMTADAAPDPVSPSEAVTLSNIVQTLSVPSSIFIAGYNLGLLAAGANSVPATVRTSIEAANTAEGTQDTNAAQGSIEIFVGDPDTVPGSGDEFATDGSIAVSYDDQLWTAGASGTITFREDTVMPLDADTGQGGIYLDVAIATFLHARFACSPGTVAGEDPGVVLFTDPADDIASLTVPEPRGLAQSIAALLAAAARGGSSALRRRRTV